MPDAPMNYPSRVNGRLTIDQLNFHQLYIFYVVAGHHSFSRAAEALEISQPAVSIQIQELEKALGVTLFHRRSKGLRITEVGETVYSYAQQVFSLSNKLLETVQEIQDLKTGHLTLGASTTPGEFVLPLAVGQFRLAYSGIQVQIIISNTRAIVQRILSRELDLGMVGNRPHEHTDELAIIDYTTDEIVLVAAPTHPLAKLHPVTLHQVIEQGLIAREQGSATRNAAEEHVVSLGLLPHIVMELGSNQAVKQAAAAGGGIGIISRLGVAAELKAGMLIILDVEDWNCQRPLTLIYLKDRYLSPVQRAFLNFLESRRPLPSVD